ncbi:MAG: HD domain-containing protein [Lachnospiraceae bacterium]|nr:HD domain-containing protein [Lachnospiraceae bacterium]
MNDNYGIRESFLQYAERISLIQQLSSSLIDGEESADTYSDHLKERFRKIGELAAINRNMLDNELFPLLRASGDLDTHLAEELNELADILFSIASGNEDGENLDLPVSSMIADRLILDADHKDNIQARIRCMNSEAAACYSMLHMTGRITADPSLSRIYTEKGLALGEEFICMLEPDFFLLIPDVEQRMLVLNNACFMARFFELFRNDDAMNSYNLDILDRMLDIAEDEFYHEEAPGFDWKLFTFRSLEYYVRCTEANNLRGFSDELLERIEYRADQLEELLSSDPAYFENVSGAAVCPVHIARCRYLAGSLKKEVYSELLLSVYEARNKEDFSIDGIGFNALLPLELLSLPDPQELSSREALLVRSLYRDLSHYLSVCPNPGDLMKMLDYYILAVDRFICIPSGVDFEEFMLLSLAGAHPPTYVHSRMVGQIAECLCHHLLNTAPERFIGFPGCADVDDVKQKREEITRFAYHAALCHDFGKIYIVDTIFVYGRGLLDMEYDLIKAHPVLGAELVSRHESTRRYADVVRAHHRWHDGNGGYPDGPDLSDSPYRTIIDLVLCADCMDAATDPVGRGAHHDKNLGTFKKEIREGAGTRYAPWLSELVDRPAVTSDLEYLLTKGREIHYRETYALLRNIRGGSV